MLTVWVIDEDCGTGQLAPGSAEVLKLQCCVPVPGAARAFLFVRVCTAHVHARGAS